jgi:D-alanyl-lipoteichoic acid acyltransferase DltB (MBOAT superfamily)
MSFLSSEFLLLAVSAVVLLQILRGAARTLAFLALNVWFVASYLTPAGIAPTLGFVLAGYACVRFAAWRPRARWLAIVLLTTAFVVMRGYRFLDWILPEGEIAEVVATVGLSFLFFKILHVVIEAGGTLEAPRPLDFLNYCLNFTTFLLGPIQRFQDYRADWTGENDALPRTFEEALDAFNRVLRGLVKKFVVAELLVMHALGPETDVGALSLGDVTLKAYVFYFFLYFDFSGYCDIVIGVGRLMGVRPPENFRLPFLAPNVSEYWLRVHRSLTTWLTDFVFTPLYALGLRNGAGRVPTLSITAGCLVVTMLVAGLWHGTTFNFALFGLLHGAYLVGFRVYEHLMRRWMTPRGFRRFRGTLASRALGVLLTFHLTSVAYVLFALDAEQLRALGVRMVGA